MPSVAAMPAPRLALFDLDNTLLSGDSDVEWPKYLISQGILDPVIAAEANQRFYEHYKAGTLDIHEFLAFQLAPLGQHPRAQLDAWHREYMRLHIMPILGDAARALVKRHRDQGDLTVIITATNRFVTRPIAEELGVDALIATELEEQGGQFTGRPQGTPCFQDGKIVRLEAWLAARGQTWSDFGETWFYSDSHNDLPLLRRVSHPVAVDPDPTLLDHARSMGWPILSLRQP